MSSLDRVPLESYKYALLAHDADSLLDDLGRLLAQPPWMADALCKEHPELSWFPGRGGDTDTPKAVCGDCLVREQCLAHALADPWTEGIWGGTSKVGRLRMRRTAA